MESGIYFGDVDREVGSLRSGLEFDDDLWEQCREFTPRKKPRAFPWAAAEIANQFGRPYDHDDYPHLGAPGGPFDAFDARFVRVISMQFGSRLGKTFFAQCCMLFTAANDPSPMMHANATQDLCVDVVERLQLMVKFRPKLRELMASQHEKDWRQDEMAFNACKMEGAWALSVSTLADKDVKVGHAAEVDKWTHFKTAKEGHPLKLFQDRFKNYMAVRKVIIESTPTIKGHSVIEDSVQSGSVCSLHVPCPFCKRYQRIEMGGEAFGYGLKWSRKENGESDSTLARATAHYVCRHCQHRIDSHDRPWMIRRGVWVPRGCHVDDAAAIAAAEVRLRPSSREAESTWQGWGASPWIVGTPERDGPHQSYQLSSLYALSLTWGDIAEEFVNCHDRPGQLKNFVNQWLGETWESRRSKSSPEKLAERIGTRRPRRMVPQWGRFLTVTIDQQAALGGFVKYVVMAHGEGDRSAVIDHGACRSREDAWSTACRTTYPHEDCGPPLMPVFTGIDSGWDTRNTYEFVNRFPGLIVALKGSDSDLGGKAWDLRTLGEDGTRTRTGADGQSLLWVNTDFWETDLQQRLDTRLADEALSLTLSAAAASDRDFIAELMNGEQSDKVDKRGNPRLLWVKRHEDKPNDYRDAIRYGLCLAQAWLKENGGMPERKGANPQPARASAAVQPPTGGEQAGGFVRRPGSGWVRRGTR